ncbi:MAG: alpha/beta hydrolase, partial [Clostridia bacterium]|nr:alpha/beta hydrolase [Clostridia bacterium]
MVFHTYGNKENKAVVLIHGMLSPYQIWNRVVQEFEDGYYVIVPELDAHTEDETSTFISVED